MNNKYDVIVIGGGIIGSSVTYYLSKLGNKVLQIEKEDITKGSAGATDGVVGYHTKKPGVQMDLAVQSIKLFDNLSEELGEDVEYEKNCGGMQPVEDKEQWDILSEIVKKQRESDVDIEMISIEKALEIEPELNPNLYGALYSKTGGKVNPIKLTYGFNHAAKRLGATVLLHTEVMDIIVEDNKVKGVKTDKGDFYSDKVVNACGSYSAQIGKMVGLDIPIKPRKGQLIISEPIGPFMEATVQCARYNIIKFNPDSIKDKNVLKLGSSLSIEQTKEGTLVIGGTREFSGFDKENTLEGIEVMLKRAVEFFPAIKDLNFIRAFAGLRPFTPDGLPLIGEVDKIKGFYIAAGHEGDGIALAPISGKLLAELITDGKPSYNIDHFSPNRFEL